MSTPSRRAPRAHQERFRHVYAEHVDRVLGYALRRTDRPEDAADVVAETFLVAWRRLGDVPEEPRTRLWLYGVARRVLANQRRGERRRTSLGERLAADLATADDIDTAMKLGCALPMGPFELLDVVGNDVSLAIQRELYLEFREPGFAPAPLLEHLVTAGYLGRKTKRGFRDYGG